MARVFEIDHSDSLWRLKARGHVLSEFKEKSRALAEGVRLAMSNEPSTLIVKRPGGAIETAVHLWARRACIEAPA